MTSFIITLYAELVNLIIAIPKTICYTKPHMVGDDFRKAFCCLYSDLRFKSQTGNLHLIYLREWCGTNSITSFSAQLKVGNDKCLMHICGHAEDVWLNA